jgi:hypothetical protein
MYVELGDNFRLPRSTVPSSRHSPLADHLHLTVTSSIASSRRKMTFLQLLSLETSHHVYHLAFPFITADVEDSIILGISLRS